MNIASLKAWVEVVGALLTGLSLVAAGIIYLWKREWRARVQLSVGIESFCKVNGAFLLEPVCIIENKGLLRCQIYKLDFSVRYLLRSDQLEQGDNSLLEATRFPHRAVKVQFVKPEWEWSYVEAGIKARYSHVIHIPEDAIAILVWAKVYHRKNVTDDFFATQGMFPIVGDKLLREKI
jgi:hypothetical protein